MAVPPGVGLKIERANEHLMDLHARGERFQRTNPNSVTVETDAETGDKIWIVHIREGPPPLHGAISGEVVHGLRTALDHMMCALVEANGGKVTNAIEFPIFASANSYQTKSAGKVQGAAQEAIDAIDALKPYKGGHEGFWRIHKLDLIDKHRQLVTVVGSYEGLIVDFGRKMADAFPDVEWLPSDLTMPVEIRPAERCPVNDGDVLFRMPASDYTEADDHTQFRLNVAFDEPGVIECEPMFPALVDLRDLTVSTVNALSAFL